MRSNALRSTTRSFMTGNARARHDYEILETWEAGVMLLGMGSHFEVWDAATYTAKEQAAMAQGMPDALKNFSF